MHFLLEQFQKLSRCKDLAAHLLEQNQKDSSWVSVIDVLSDQYLNKKEFASSSRRPEAKVETAVEPKAEAEAKPKTESIAASETGGVNKSFARKVNKGLTPKVRRKILNRDKCCQFRDPITGRECGSTFKLQIDHKTPRWAGGRHTEENLQVFCKMHNQLKYRKETQLRFI